MIIEFTGRQCDVTPAIRTQVEHGLNKLIKILGQNFKTNVILTAEKYRQIAEITVKVRHHAIVGLGENGDMTSAVGEALARIERQALKYKGRWRARKRQPKQQFAAEAESPTATTKTKTLAVGAGTSTAVPVVVHSFPASFRITEAHVVTSRDSVALRPMTLEEAVKEAEFRDREVFVFRDDKGRVKVLHRKKDGKLELIEAP